MTSPASYQRIGIVGAGTIGSGIALLTATLGATTTVVVAPRPGGVERARALLGRSFAGEVKRGKLTPEDAEAALSRMVFSPDYAALAGCEFVVESVAEDLQTKREVLAQVEAHTGPECIFGSNTTSIPIGQIAAHAARPGNAVGMHYFWPAQRYKLVEVARPVAATPDTMERVSAFMRWQGKTVLLTSDTPGFFTSRVLMAFIAECVALMVEGAPIERIDAALTGWGWPMGPFRLMDTLGIENMRGWQAWLRPVMGERMDAMARLWPALEAGHTGAKHGKGFYRYPDGQRADERVPALVGAGGGGAALSDEELVRRPVFQLLNEIGWCLAEGVVESPQAADLGALLGIGWPQARGGGPLGWAKEIGPANLMAQLSQWAEQIGPRFAPAPALLERF